jgi:hypothetical protein
VTPTDIKHYLVERRQSTLQEMARHFNAEPNAVEGVLEFWLRKGKVMRRTAAKCSGCNQCGTSAASIYEWQA